ncbi:cell division protein ZipA [Halomonas sp. THAF12]|uniref:cell division protein ZipA n=1 Tax=Halomonas sp. B23F22_10 TaxID=3459515 RepID=UPI00373E82FA
MELREWLIILGLALVTLIVIDGVRRLQRQRLVPRLDQAGHDAQGPDEDPEAVAREAEINWELPNGGARVVRPADERGVQPKPKLQRQDHPGPSRILSEFRRQQGDQESAESLPPKVQRQAEDRPLRESERPFAARHREEQDVASAHARVADAAEARPSADAGRPAPAEAPPNDAARREPALGDDAERPEADAPEPLVADPADHDGYDEEHYRLVDLEGMGDSLKSGSRRVGSSVQRFGASLQKNLAERRDQKRARREQEKAEKAKREQAAREARQAEKVKREQAAREAQQAEEVARQQREAEARAHEVERRQAAELEENDPLFAPRREASAESSSPPPQEDDVVRAHPVLEKALRHDVDADHARDTLGEAEELIVISVMARGEEGFSGTALLDLMLACGLRYSRDMGIFHRFETEDPGSALQFSMVNVVKPGTFPIEAMDDFLTPGITLLMPLPGASDTSAAFEAMVETAMVIVRHLGGELKDENMSVMTAQTVEFARQRVQEFERRHRLHRYQVN